MAKQRALEGEQQQSFPNKLYYAIGHRFLPCHPASLDGDDDSKALGCAFSINSSPLPRPAETQQNAIWHSIFFSRLPTVTAPRWKGWKYESPPTHPGSRLLHAHLLAGGGRALLPQAAPIEQVARLQVEHAGLPQQDPGAAALGPHVAVQIWALRLSYSCCGETGGRPSTAKAASCSERSGRIAAAAWADFLGDDDD